MQAGLLEPHQSKITRIKKRGLKIWHWRGDSAASKTAAGSPMNARLGEDLSARPRHKKKKKKEGRVNVKFCHGTWLNGFWKLVSPAMVPLLESNPFVIITIYLLPSGCIFFQRPCAASRDMVPLHCRALPMAPTIVALGIRRLKSGTPWTWRPALPFFGCYVACANSWCYLAWFFWLQWLDIFWYNII